MDFFVKYFSKDRVVCRYLTSRFLGHTCAEDLKKEFEEAIQELDMKKMVQVSIDGPNVNWKLYDSIVEERNQNDDYLALIDIGPCSLHVVHGVFRSGVQKTEWGCTLGHAHLFDESPAKREDYQSITGSKVFPVPFSGHRWIENKKGADRALDVWPNIAKYVYETLKKPKSKIPGSSSFSTLRTAVQDSLIVAKLQFFSSTATMMLYLQKFQGNVPLVPFMTTEVTYYFRL